MADLITSLVTALEVAQSLEAETSGNTIFAGDFWDRIYGSLSRKEQRDATVLCSPIYNQMIGDLLNCVNSEDRVWVNTGGGLGRSSSNLALMLRKVATSLHDRILNPPSL